MKKILWAVCLSVLCFDIGAKVEETPVITNKLENIRWVRRPSIQFSNVELQGYDRTVIVRFSANESGFITSAEIVKSSRLDEIDNKVITVINRSRLKPYQVNGISYPITAEQPFIMMVSRDAEYKKFPKIPVRKIDLQGRNREVVVYAEADDNGHVTRAEIKTSSGLKVFDQYVLREYRKQARFKPLSINGKPYPITKSTRFYFNERDAIE